MQEKKYINLYCAGEVREWCRLFECREEELIYAVKAVGNSPMMAGRFIRENRFNPDLLSEFRMISKEIQRKKDK